MTVSESEEESPHEEEMTIGIAFPLQFKPVFSKPQGGRRHGDITEESVDQGVLG